MTMNSQHVFYFTRITVSDQFAKLKLIKTLPNYNVHGREIKLRKRKDSDPHHVNGRKENTITLPLINKTAAILNYATINVLYGESLDIQVCDTQKCTTEERFSRQKVLELQWSARWINLMMQKLPHP